MPAIIARLPAGLVAVDIASECAHCRLSVLGFVVDHEPSEIAHLVV